MLLPPQVLIVLFSINVDVVHMMLGNGDFRSYASVLMPIGKLIVSFLVCGRGAGRRMGRE